MQTNIVPAYTAATRTRFDRGMARGAQSVRWYRAMITRLRVASNTYYALGMVGQAMACLDRAYECEGYASDDN
jgi:hypothetical protein